MTTDTAPIAQGTTGGRPRLSWARRMAVQGSFWAAKGLVWAREQKIGASLPGLGCLALVSAGLAMRFGIWAGLIAAGIGLGSIDRRL